MKSARISIFCLRQELAAWLQRLMEEKGLGALLYLRSEGSARLVQTKDGLSLPDDVYIAFLAPTSELAERRPLKLNDAEPRIWGWLDLRPGAIFTEPPPGIVGLTQIVGEDFGGHSGRTIKWVKLLRRKLSGVVHRGVTGENIKYGGQSEYKNIAYSDGALQFLESGGKWKDGPTDNAEFYPLKGRSGRVAPGDCSPGAPTDPYVQNYRIRFLK